MMNNAQPLFTAEMGAHLSYEFLDDLVAEQVGIFDEIDGRRSISKTHGEGRHRMTVRVELPAVDRQKSDVWWAIKILRKMERLGYAPSRIWHTSQAQQSILHADWIWDYLRSKGISIEWWYRGGNGNKDGTALYFCNGERVG